VLHERSPSTTTSYRPVRRRQPRLPCRRAEDAGHHAPRALTTWAAVSPAGRPRWGVSSIRGPSAERARLLTSQATGVPDHDRGREKAGGVRAYPPLSMRQWRQRVEVGIREVRSEGITAVTPGRSALGPNAFHLESLPRRSLNLRRGNGLREGKPKPQLLSRGFAMMRRACAGVGGPGGLFSPGG
jgi:hypothetical protein